MSQTTTTSTDQWPIVSRYTRAQALADAVLIAADPAMARQAGWKHPVAYTAGVHSAMIAWSEQIDIDKDVFTGQDEIGRAWDVLYMAARAARSAEATTDRIAFTMFAVPPTGEQVEAVEADLVAHIGPGDTPEPVITIMLPDED